jgi:hypothetical protein
VSVEATASADESRNSAAAGVVTFELDPQKLKFTTSFEEAEDGVTEIGVKISAPSEL